MLFLNNGDFIMFYFLYRSHLNLSSCPERVGFMGHQLTSLDLSNNRLHSLPVEIGCLMGLQQLYLQHNDLKQLPVKLLCFHSYQITVLLNTNNLIRTWDIRAGFIKKIFFFFFSFTFCFRDIIFRFFLYTFKGQGAQPLDKKKLESVVLFPRWPPPIFLACVHFKSRLLSFIIIKLYTVDKKVTTRDDFVK